MRTALKDAQVTLYFKNHINQQPITGYYIDLSNFRDPIGNPVLRTLSGADAVVQEYIRADKRTPAVLHSINMIVEDIIHGQKIDYVSISLFDRKGLWISQAMAELAAAELDKRGFKVHVYNAVR